MQIVAYGMHHTNPIGIPRDVSFFCLDGIERAELYTGDGNDGIARKMARMPEGMNPAKIMQIQSTPCSAFLSGVPYAG